MCNNTEYDSKAYCVQGLMLASAFKVSATLAANIGFLQGSSANKLEVQDCDVYEVRRFRITDKK